MFRSCSYGLAALLAATLLACSGPAPSWDRDEVAATFEDLHSRVYQVYALGPDRDRLHDLLTESFVGEALTEEYVEHFRTLVQMQRDHTRIEVLAVDYESVGVEPDAEGGFRVAADWSVGGVVSHQRHSHPRVNRYRAHFRLVPLESSAAGRSQLRIAETWLGSLERVASLQALTSSPFDQLPTSARGTLSLGDLLRSGVVETPGREDTAEAEEPPKP